VKATHSDDPCYTYNPETRAIRDGIHRTGVVIMAVDNLPCELPRESTETFSAALAPLVPYLCRADFSKPFAELDLPAPLRRAVILHRGKFTPDYTYMSRFIDGAGA
jgi:saccharopine dehydrogenase (NAD+, L-lysine-forming)